MKTAQHLSPEDLARFVRGDDTEIDTAALHEHVRDCEVCRAALEREAQTELMMETVATSVAMCPSCQRTTDDERCDHCGAAIRPGGYFVEQVLVTSQHGRLYLARDEDGRRLALKELVFTQVPDIGTLTAFEREAKLLRELDHPGIPRFINSFREGEGVQTRLYLAQEYIEGASLAQHLETHRFTEPELMRIAARVLEILVYLQSISPPIFHRDIKPANLIMKLDGTVALVDFGAARDLGATGGASLVGTFGYIPPEQLVGVVDPTSDLYALGATLLHLATRRPPWQLITQSAPLASARLSESFGAFLTKLCAQDRRERFGDARTALVALRSGSTKEKKKMVGPKTALGIVLAVAAAGATATGGYFLYENEPQTVVESIPMTPTARAKKTTTNSRRPNRMRKDLRRKGAAAVRIGSTVLAFGGEPVGFESGLATMHWRHGVWSDYGMDIVTTRVDASATQLTPNEILIVGGDGTGHEVEICDVKARRCAKTTRTNEPRVGHEAIRLPSGRVLVVGGSASPYTAEIYDPNTWRWKRATPPPRVDGRPAHMLRRTDGGPAEAFDGQRHVATYVESRDIWRLSTDTGPAPNIIGPDELVCRGADGSKMPSSWRRKRGFSVVLGDDLLVAGGGHVDTMHENATTFCRPKRAMPQRRRTSSSDVAEIFRAGNQFLMRGELKRAEKALLECVALDPRHAKCHRSLGVLYAQFDNYPRSVRHYKQYLKLAPDGPEADRVRKLIDDSSIE